MAQIVQFHRMSSSQAATYIGPQGELIVDTGANAIRIQDGSTPGGWLVPLAALNLSDLTNALLARENLKAAGLPDNNVFTGNNILEGTTDFTQIPVVGTANAGDNSDAAASTKYIDRQFAAGAFIPNDASGAGLAFTGVNCFYNKVPGMCWIGGSLTYPANASGAPALIGNLPYTSLNSGVSSYIGMVYFNGGGGQPNGRSMPYELVISPNSKNMGASYGGGVAFINSELAGYPVSFSVIYPTAS